jgi:hypothetical protein
MANGVRLKAFYLIDFMGAGGLTPEEEVAETMSHLQELGLPIDLAVWSYSFNEINDSPHIDIVILDYGGVLPGCDDMVKSQIRSVYSWASEHPGKLVLVWSSFTWDLYRDEMLEAFGDLENVKYAFADNGDYDDVIIQWFQLARQLPEKFNTPLNVPGRVK